MSDPSLPTRRPSPRGPADQSGDCPPAEILSAFMDGVLDEARRSAVEDHVSRCEDCYWIVRETGIFLNGTDQRTAVAARHVQAAWKQSRLLAPIAAALVAATAIGIWRQTRPVDYGSVVTPLVEATGERRYIGGRLTGGFRYGPEAGRVRAAGPGPERPLDLRAAAAKAIDDAAGSPTLVRRRAAAAAQLLLGDVDAAVRSLEALSQEEPIDAAVRNDLAAAYLERAEGGGAGDYERALQAATEATRLDPRLPEAWFNQALAASALQKFPTATTAVERLNTLERDSRWTTLLRRR